MYIFVYFGLLCGRHLVHALEKRLCSASLLPHLCIDVVEVTIRCLNVLEQLYMVSF